MARQNRTMKVFNSVAAGATVNTDSGAVPNGQKTKLTKFGGFDMNSGDNKSSAIQLQFGNPGGGTMTTLWAIALSGSTFELCLPDDLVITGDGTSVVRLVRTSTSNSAKNIGAWLEGYDL